MRRRISKKGGLLPPSFLPMGWKTGVFRATARDGGCTALRCGNEPPFSFRLRRKDCARRRVSEPTAAKRRLLGGDKRPFTVKRKGALCPNPARLCRFGQVRGSGETVRRRLGGLCRVRLGLGEQRWRFPAWGVGLSGWLTDLAPFWPRTFRFATRCPGGSGKRSRQSRSCTPTHESSSSRADN